MTMRLEARLEVPLGGTDAERRLSGRQLAGRGRVGYGYVGSGRASWSRASFFEREIAGSKNDWRLQDGNQNPKSHVRTSAES